MYLTADDSVKLLEAVQGEYAERDYCILTLFLNCGLRVSELVGLNLTDFQRDTVRVTGKGGKERTVYLNEACADAITSTCRTVSARTTGIKTRCSSAATATASVSRR